ncbi:MAG: cupin domain-containing protein [Actinomycetota bacterium]|nr:cupin domain-containing protein [Actinomycetota bacterium]
MEIDPLFGVPGVGVVSRRLIAVDTFGALLGISSDAGEEVLEGNPSAASAELAAIGGVEIGLWEMTPGTVRDVESEEIFLVVGGRGRVEFDDGEVLDLEVGAVVHLRAGDRTIWTVFEPLRKLYISPVT